MAEAAADLTRRLTKRAADRACLPRRRQSGRPPAAGARHEREGAAGAQGRDVPHLHLRLRRPSLRAERATPRVTEWLIFLAGLTIPAALRRG